MASVGDQRCQDKAVFIYHSLAKDPGQEKETIKWHKEGLAGEGRALVSHYFLLNASYVNCFCSV